MKRTTNHQAHQGRRAFLQKMGIGVAGITAVRCGPGGETFLQDEESAVTGAASECTKAGLPARIYFASPGNGGTMISANGIPGHTIGVFPNPDCPIPVEAQTTWYQGTLYDWRSFWVTSSPARAASVTPVHGWIFGIAVSGVPFDPTGPFWSGTPGYFSDYPWNVPPLPYEPWSFDVMSATAKPFLGLDGSNAHSQPGGEYHYHGLPHGLISNLAKAAGTVQHMPVIGHAADGFRIYASNGPSEAMVPGSPLRRMTTSYRLKSGLRPSGAPRGSYDGTFVQDYEYVPGLGDLDECNGRFGVTPESPYGAYHYYVTDRFPYVPRFYRGTPHESFYHPLPPTGDNNPALPPTLRTYGR